SFFLFSSRRRHTRSKRDWSSDVCSSDLAAAFSFEPADSLTPWPAGISIASPVRGLRPVRAARLVRSTENQPGIVIFSPLETCERSEERRVGKECRAGRWRTQVQETRLLL